MSYVCAKPGCSNSVLLWLDFAPSDQRVVERSSRGDCSVGLCETHAGRFTVPSGWTFERLDGVLDPSEGNATTSGPTPSTSQQGHHLERPWFLAHSDREPGEAETNGVTESEATDASGRAEPTVGSLLHRAFHGPDRKADAHRAALDELESRRAARAHNDDGTIELPFPPCEPEHHIAVS